MVTCEVGSITAGGMPVSLVMGDGMWSLRRSKVTHQLVLQGDRSVWSQNMSAGLPVQ